MAGSNIPLCFLYLISGRNGVRRSGGVFSIEMKAHDNVSNNFSNLGDKMPFGNGSTLGSVAVRSQHQGAASAVVGTSFWDLGLPQRQDNIRVAHGIVCEAKQEAICALVTEAPSAQCSVVFC